MTDDPDTLLQFKRDLMVQIAKVDVKLCSAARRHPLDNIRDVVCHYYGITAEDLHGKDRTKHLCVARHAFCYLTRTQHHGRVSYPAIGRYLSRDHTTAMAGMRAAKRLIESDPVFCDDIDQLERVLAGPDVTKVFTKSRVADKSG